MDNPKKMVLSEYKVPTSEDIAYMYVGLMMVQNLRTSRRSHNMKPPFHTFYCLNLLFRSTLFSVRSALDLCHFRPCFSLLNIYLKCSSLAFFRGKKDSTSIQSHLKLALDCFGPSDEGFFMTDI